MKKKSIQVADPVCETPDGTIVVLDGAELATEVVFSELAGPAFYPRADKNPCLGYLGSLSEKNSRPTMLMALRRAARLLRSDLEPREFPWHALRATHTGFLRSRLLALPPSTANQTLAAVRGVLEWCWTFELILSEDRARAISVMKSVKGERLIMGRYIHREEIDAMLAACGTDEVGLRNKTAVHVLRNSGLRREEIAELQLRNIHLEAADPYFTVIGKGNKERLLFINAELRVAMEEWMTVRGASAGPFLLAAATTGKLLRDRTEPLDGEAIFAAVQKLCANARIKKVTPHDFRRTFISNLLAAGVDLVTVSKIAGHSDTKTTAKYDRRDEQTQKEAMKYAWKRLSGRT
jgi:site-specific recombinase XerD